MKNIERGLILTAGPSITNVEIDSVFEAVCEGWNTRHSEWIRKFQEAFASFIGVKYAMCTSSCTGALHLSLAALGLKEGDEILVPENTWVASGIAPLYVKATPRFVDIEEDTWNMDPMSLEKHITPRTKAIIPVHLYGNPCNMDKIMDIARKHNLLVIEDAAPSVGAHWRGQKTGSFGHTSAFSFQGAKIMVTGEGGMFCTNDEKVYKKAQYLNDYAVDTNKSFWIDEPGFKYRMSNLQAALGIAQLKRIEELVDRKRQIFSWYKERLEHLEEMKLNVERENSKNIYWMTSVILAQDLKISRDDFRTKLKERKVDSRPFFFPMSSLPMFASQEKVNPVAYSIAGRGVNLPSGHNLREDDVDYICEVILDTIGKKKPTKKLSYKPGPIAKILDLKNPAAQAPLSLPIVQNGKNVGSLEAITYKSIEDKSTVELLTKWRNENIHAFLVESEATTDGTIAWLRAATLDAKDRLLFWVLDTAGKRIGHVGLNRVSLDERTCEIDNIIRGEKYGNKGLMTAAIETMLSWQRQFLAIPGSYLRVFSDNNRAIKLYERLGYREIQRTPLKATKEGNTTKWHEVHNQPYLEVERYFVTMKLG